MSGEYAPAADTPGSGAVVAGTSGRRRALRLAVAVVGFAALTAAGARISLPVPGTPVPFTFQVVAVLLAGYLLGPGAAAASQALYLAAGVAGLPVFAAGGGAAYLLGPTGGYLLAYPAAAAVVAWLAGPRRAVLRDASGLLAGVAVIHLGGASWLAIVSGHPAPVAAGIVPFLLVDVVKALLVLVAGRRIRGPARRLLRP